MLGACQRDCLRMRGSVERGGGRWGAGVERQWRERERKRDGGKEGERGKDEQRERETERDGVERERDGGKEREREKEKQVTQAFYLSLEDFKQSKIGRTKRERVS